MKSDFYYAAKASATRLLELEKESCSKTVIKKMIENVRKRDFSCPAGEGVARKADAKNAGQKGWNYSNFLWHLIKTQPLDLQNGLIEWFVSHLEEC